MKKWIISIIAIMFVTIAAGISYYYYVWNDHGKEQRKSIAIAKKEYDIKKVENIDHYYGSHGAFDVIKAKINGEDDYIFVPLTKKGEMRKIDSEDGWNARKVTQYAQNELSGDLVSIHLGLEKYKEDSNFTPVWEIVLKGNNQYTFHYIRYKDGSFFKTYTMNQQI